MLFTIDVWCIGNSRLHQLSSAFQAITHHTSNSCTSQAGRVAYLALHGAFSPPPTSSAAAMGFVLSAIGYVAGYLAILFQAICIGALDA